MDAGLFRLARTSVRHTNPAPSTRRGRVRPTACPRRARMARARRCGRARRADESGRIFPALTSFRALRRAVRCPRSPAPPHPRRRPWRAAPRGSAGPHFSKGRRLRSPARTSRERSCRRDGGRIGRHGTEARNVPAPRQWPAARRNGAQGAMRGAAHAAPAGGERGIVRFRTTRADGATGHGASPRTHDTIRLSSRRTRAAPPPPASRRPRGRR